jgi:hypothetical protein
MSIEIKNFRKFSKGTLLGFGDIFLPAAGIEIKDVSLHQENSEKLVAMPSRQFQDENGEKKYSPYIRFPDKKKWEAFQREAVRGFNEYLEMNQVPSQDQAKETHVPFQGMEPLAVIV